MRRWINCIALMLAAVSIPGCFIAQGIMSGSPKPRTVEGTLVPPPTGDHATSGWTLSVGGLADAQALELSEAQVAAARALEGKLVSVSVELVSRPLQGHVYIVRAIARDRLTGTLTRVPISTRYPTGWKFATTFHGMPLDVALDPSAVMPAAEQLAGKRAVFTGSLATTPGSAILKADTLEPQ